MRKAKLQDQLKLNWINN